MNLETFEYFLKKIHEFLIVIKTQKGKKRERSKGKSKSEVASTPSVP